MRTIAFLLLAGVSSSSSAQQLLELPVAASCQYRGTGFPPELYRFPSDTVAGIVAEIVERTGKEKNFELVASNVASVAAIIDSSGKRWIFYSRKHFLNEDNPDYRIAALAHAVGHHLIGHELSDDPVLRETEEAEADEFMGFALYRMGVGRMAADSMAEWYPMDHGLAGPERHLAIMRGYERGEASVLILPHASFKDDGSGNAIPGIPEFPFPPPQVSASMEINDYFKQCRTLADVDKKLCQALKTCGYHERRYYYVKNGFALVTRMEQIQENGYPLQSNRWNPRPVRDESFSLSSFLSALFTSKPGYFRVFVFIATEEPFSTRRDRQISREDATNWLNEGVFKLPVEIGRIARTEKTTVAALVYEFQVPESTLRAFLSKPSALDGNTHLRTAKILSALR